MKLPIPQKLEYSEYKNFPELLLQVQFLVLFFVVLLQDKDLLLQVFCLIIEVHLFCLLQCVPDTLNSCVILESTANGVGGYFYDMWQKATRGENDFIPLF